MITVEAPWGQARADYIVTPLDVPASVFTSATGVNNATTVVGGYAGSYNGHGGVFGYVWNVGGGYSTLEAVPGTTAQPSYTVARSINDHGVVVGYYNDPRGYQGGFLYDNGSYTTGIRGPGSGNTFLTGINNNGQFVGFDTGTSRSQGFLYSGGAYTIIDVPGANLGTTPSAINDAGTIVGSYLVGDLSTGIYTSYGFIYSGGTYTTGIGLPGASYSVVTGINNKGDIVGDSDIGHFLYHGGTYTRLDITTPGNFYGTGAINDLGEIAGAYSTVDQGNQRSHAFLAYTHAPAPEPSSLILTGMGIATLGGYAWLRRKRVA
jgi:probable HAF family extracellular repeat protein